MIRYSTRTARAFSTQALFAASLFMLGACQQAERGAATSGPTELEWARAALERNPQIEVIAADAEARVFTIRDTQSGEVHAVKLDELAAVPTSRLTAQAPSPQPNLAQEPVPATSAESTAAPAAEDLEATDESGVQSRMTAAPTSTSEPQSDQAASYTIERSDGQVRVSGPGVSIVSSGGAPDSDTARMGNNAVEPIVCEGRRMVHLDNREIYVDGDAIIVRGGCEMFITNSRIAASGTGVVVQDGTVHISNSEVEGAQNSIDAGSEAKLFVRGSTFRGMSRRAQEAVVQDQGGNRWR